METLPKCLLLPVDGSQESLRPAQFLADLYPQRDTIDIILCYFLPPLPPIYRQRPDSPEMYAKLKAMQTVRDKNKRSILDRAREFLISIGFSGEHIQEHVEEKALSVGRQTCILAERKKVDAVLVQKQVVRSLEDFLSSDISSALLQHCLTSPIWLIDGNVDPSRAVILLEDEHTSLRAVDHAAFMLEETDTHITLLYLAKSVKAALKCPAFSLDAEMGEWLKSSAGKDVLPIVMEAKAILKEGGVSEERLDLTVLPGRGNKASEVTSYCREAGIGIVVLGHSHPTGIWSFLKSSVTQKMLTELHDMALWINQ